MDNMSSLPPVISTPLRRIEHPKGDIFHGMKASDVGYAGFGEAYFTTIIQGETKGWKQHRKMVMNLVVPLGIVRFYVHDERHGRTAVHDIGIPNYRRLTIPPGYWVAFEGLASSTNLVCNLASFEHDPTEAVNQPLENYPLLSA
jgi:dTDP-4-dehydrorhamnose 3,5-epimerase